MHGIDSLHTADVLPAMAGPMPTGGNGVETGAGGSSGRTLTEWQIREQRRRIDLVVSANSMKARRISLRSAAAILNEPVANLSRWIKARTNGGDEALIPDVSPGRKQKFSLGDDETRALRLLALKKGSIPTAIEWFAQDPACLPSTRELILAELDRAARCRILPHWPDSLRRAARPTVDEELAFRGRKASMAVEFVERRSMDWVDADGIRREMKPNTVWESDDMSSNEPFTWVENGREGEQLLRIGRQTLCTIDVFSANWLGISPVGRERDAYRAEDIADHMLDCVNAHGMPRIWRLERGPWENTFIDGVLLGRTPEGREIRWGGLDPLIHIERAWKSRQKGTVESSFNYLQTLLAHQSTSIGRVRGEFEQQTKLYLAASKGDPEAWARFWSMGEFAEAAATAMHQFNHRPKNRRAHGKGLVVPADLYAGAERRDCPADQLWRFCPEKRLATVRQGHIECSVRHYPLNFRFRVNGVRDGLHLEHGYSVLIAFHPGRPELGCHIFNAERGARNREQFAFGELLMIAPIAEDAPQVNLSPVERAFHARRQANATMRGEFRAIMATGAPVVRRSSARDGFGNSREILSTGRAGQIPPARNHDELPTGGDAKQRGMKPARPVDPPSSDEFDLERLKELEAAAQLRSSNGPRTFTAISFEVLRAFHHRVVLLTRRRKTSSRLRQTAQQSNGALEPWQSATRALLSHSRQHLQLRHQRCSSVRLRRQTLEMPIRRSSKPGIR